MTAIPDECPACGHWTPSDPWPWWTEHDAGRVLCGKCGEWSGPLLHADQVDFPRASEGNQLRTAIRDKKASARVLEPRVKTPPPHENARAPQGGGSQGHRPRGVAAAPRCVNCGEPADPAERGAFLGFPYCSAKCRRDAAGWFAEAVASPILGRRAFENRKGKGGDD